MPKKLEAAEARFLRCYIKLGPKEENIPTAEKQARVKRGTAVKMLKLKRVQEALKEITEPIRLEQERQALVGDAVEQVTASLKAELAQVKADLANATQMPPMRVTGNEETIEQELMRLIRLCPEKHGRVKLAAIQTGLVVLGTMEQGNTRRVAPPENPLQPVGGAGGIYKNLFDRQRAEQPALSESAPTPPPTLDGVFDLVPVPVAAPVPVKLPPPGESIDPVVPAVVKSKATVMTVDLG